jgi:hypothetical protein
MSASEYDSFKERKWKGHVTMLAISFVIMLYMVWSIITVVIDAPIALIVFGWAGIAFYVSSVANNPPKWAQVIAFAPFVALAIGLVVMIGMGIAKHLGAS